MSEWQPIETADNDSMAVVILWDGRRVFPGWRGNLGWMDCQQGEYDMKPIDPQPTRWQPLPEPPI